MWWTWQACEQSCDIDQVLTALLDWLWIEEMLQIWGVYFNRMVIDSNSESFLYAIDNAHMLKTSAVKSNSITRFAFSMIGMRGHARLCLWKHFEFMFTNGKRVHRKFTWRSLDISSKQTGACDEKCFSVVPTRIFWSHLKQTHKWMKLSIWFNQIFESCFCLHLKIPHFTNDRTKKTKSGYPSDRPINSTKTESCCTRRVENISKQEQSKTHQQRQQQEYFPTAN